VLIGGIEAGGTKFICAVSRGGPELLREERFPTGLPRETLEKAAAFFAAARKDFGSLDAVGIGSFGPVDPKRSSPTFGFIMKTPKRDWIDTDIVGPIARATGVPVGFDTDVNAAALAEKKWGAGSDVESLLYLTVGTGIGGGATLPSGLLHGLVHPEMGHIPVRRDPERDPFAGVCPFHGDCLEGLANGPAIQARWGKPAFELPPDHPAWDLEADYLAQALAAYVCVLSPERIILGGGVMEQTRLFPMIRTKLKKALNGYIAAEALDKGIDTYVVAPALGNKAGVFGAIALGLEALS
jgi:fructokinase